MSASNVDKAALIAYDSELYSDLTAECGMYSFKLHKTIVCPQSDFFRKVVREEGWLEGTSSVVKMDAHPPDAIRAMKEFLYKGFYTVPAVRSMVQDALSKAKK